MICTDVIRKIEIKYLAIQDHLGEKGRRIWAATEAHALGHGGVSAVSKATGISRTTIHVGIKEIQSRRKDKSFREKKIWRWEEERS